MKVLSKIILLVIISVLITYQSNAFLRIAVLPFKNIDGNEEFNKWSVELQERLAAEIVNGDPEEYNYKVIPIDSIAAKVKEMQLDPHDNEYESKMWKIAESFEVDRVVSGTYIFEDGRLLINAFVYDIKLKLPHPEHQAKDLFVPPSKVDKVIPVIHKRLRQGIIGN